MKKLTCIFVVLALLVVIALLAFYSCNKAPVSVPVTDPDQQLINAARSFMQQNEPTAPPMTDSLPYTPTGLHKTPRWGLARIQYFSFGRAVVVPITIAEPIGIKVGPNQVPVSASSITWLLLYQDAAKQWHPEVITRLPNDTADGPFRGIVRVEDWQGHFMKAFQYLDDTTLSLAASSIIQRPAVQQGYTKAPSTYAALEMECVTTDWYACYSYDGVFAGCDYAYSTEECSTAGGGGGGGSVGAPSGSDYSNVGGGGSAGSAGAATSDVTANTTITSNPNVLCVWQHLMSAQLTNGLRTILSAFADNQVYNVTFVLSPSVEGDGATSYQGNNNFLVQINASEANDPSYSRIYLASTFIHEAFHAKLRQKALAIFGSTVIASWGTPIDDMDLSELANYFEQESKAENIWESVTHDWMVQNIDQLGASLQQYVQTWYHATYAAIGSNPTVYQDLMYMGLQNSTMFQEDVVSKGLLPSVTASWGKLNEGGKCND